MTTYHNYIAVIGRIPGDDEDTLLTFEHTTVEDAKANFADAMWDMDDKTYRETVFAEHGTDIFINHILVSESPMEEI